jgi:hypothetical protein
MHKNDAATEKGEPPPLELIEAMGAFIGEYAQQGIFQGGEGLPRSALRTRVTVSEGRSKVEHGPYAGVNELVAAAHLLTVKDRAEAVSWAERFGKALGDAEIEIGPVVEPWDLGMMPRPDDAPLRVLFLLKADKDSEASRARTPRQKAEVTKVTQAMNDAGVLQSSTFLAPSAKSKRLHFVNNDLKVVDGPFSESKELIGGFSILDLPDWDQVIALCKRYAKILGGTLEIDARPMVDAPQD